MKIGIIARTWFTSTKGGSERYVAKLFEELRRSHEVTVVTFGRSGDKDVVQIKLPKISLVTQVLFSFLASRKMNKFKPDICLVNQYWGEFTSLLLKVPCIPIIHDVGLFSSHSYGLKHFVRTKILELVTERAKLIIVPSKLTKADLQNHLAVSPEKIKTILEGVDLTHFKPALAKHKGINIVCVGRIAPNKGQDVLLEAFHLVKKNHRNANLYLVGSAKHHSKYSGKLQRMIETLKIEDVVVADNVYDRGLVKYYNLADIYVQPSTGDEGWGMAITEAFACKKPVICTDIFRRTGVADVDRALIVEPSNHEQMAKAIELLIENRELRRKISENGYNFVRKFSWKRTVHQILQTAKKLVPDLLEAFEEIN